MVEAKLPPQVLAEATPRFMARSFGKEALNMRSREVTEEAWEAFQNMFRRMCQTCVSPNKVWLGGFNLQNYHHFSELKLPWMDLGSGLFVGSSSGPKAPGSLGRVFWGGRVVLDDSFGVVFLWSWTGLLNWSSSGLLE